MSNACSFDLRLASASLEELTAVLDSLFRSPWDWELTGIERLLQTPDAGYRFRARVRTTEGPGTPWITGAFGLVAELLETFPELQLQVRFRDAHGYGFLDGTDKEYELEFDASDVEDDDEDDFLADEDEMPFHPQAADDLLVVGSETPLAENDAEFTQRLEAIAEVMLRVLHPTEVGCTIVDDETVEWTVSAEVERIRPEQVGELRRELRRLRVPLDTRLEGTGGPGSGVWPLSDRPWRSIF